MDNEEMADLMVGGLDYLEMEFGYDFDAALSVMDGDTDDSCIVTIYMNRQERSFESKKDR